MNITEDYVSFEVAKLLKSKKFHVPTRSHYDSRGGFGFFDISKIDWNNYKCFRERRCYSAPTIQMAMKWLREVHNFHIAVVPCEVGAGVMDYTYVLYKIDAKNFYFENLGIQGRAKNVNEISYEQSCEAAIKYCLEKLI